MNGGLHDMQPKIKVENQKIEIKREDEEDMDNNSKPCSLRDSLSDHENVFTFVTIKTEYVEENSDSMYSNENNIVEHNAGIKIKEERVKDVNINEDYHCKDYLKTFQPIPEEKGHVEIKEEMEHQNEIEDFKNFEEPLIELVESKGEIRIEEDPLRAIKNEPMSDTDTPQDGSTSQADVVDDGNLGFELLRENIIQEENILKKDLQGALNTCVICEKKLSNKSSLATHMLIHSGERPYECKKCLKKFRYKASLNNHNEIQCGEKPHECKVCGKKYTEKRILYNHMRLHTGDRPYACDICKKKFSNRSNLNKHMNIHSGARTYGCDICKKIFNLKSTLIIHMRTHTTEKKHECKICNKKYAEQQKLEVHMRVHTGERPYECEQCHKKYTEKRSLDFHMRVHNGKKLHECEICHKKYTEKWSLNAHMRKHTGERPYECEICKKKFITKSDRTQHTKRQVCSKRLLN